MSKYQQQADSEIHEELILNFLISRLDEEVSLNLANNAKIGVKDLYESFVSETAAGIPISTLSTTRKLSVEPLLPSLRQGCQDYIGAL